jgi:dolichyl-phosphate beta-glucosyltransferase
LDSLSNMYLSVIIPAFNEEQNFQRGTLNQVVKYLLQQKYTWEIILVNDGSSDGTLKLLQSFAKDQKNVKVIDNPHQGKALTVITGALAASGEIVLFSDMDQATPIQETEKILVNIGEYDVVIGSRTGRKGAPLFRQVLAYGMVVVRKIILNLPYRDTQCGFKALKSDAARKIFTTMKSLRPARTITGPAVDPGFDVELLYLGRKLGFKICEVPVVWNYQETRRVRFFYDALSGLHGLLLVRWRSLTNAYNLN